MDGDAGDDSNPIIDEETLDITEGEDTPSGDGGEPADGGTVTDPQTGGGEVGEPDDDSAGAGPAVTPAVV